MKLSDECVKRLLGAVEPLRPLCLNTDTLTVFIPQRGTASRQGSSRWRSNPPFRERGRGRRGASRSCRVGGRNVVVSGGAAGKGEPGDGHAPISTLGPAHAPCPSPA
jgi:hypothetical protein